MNGIRMRILPILVLVIAAAGVMAYASDNDAARRRAKSRHYYLAGSREFAMDNYDAAFDLYRAAYNTDTSSLEAGMSYASLLQVIYSDSAYLANNVFPLMRRYVDAFPDDYQEGMRYAQAVADPSYGDYLEAARVQERIISRFPSKTDIYMELAANYLNAGEYEKTLSAIDRYEVVEERNTTSVGRRASTYLSMGDTAAVLRTVDDFAADNPLNYSSWLMRGNAYSALNKPDTAMACYRKAQELEPESAEVKYTIMQQYISDHDTINADAVLADLMSGVDFDVEMKVRLLFQYGYDIYLRGGDESRLVPLYDALLEKEGHDPSVLDLGMRIFGRIADYKGMESTALALIELYPDEVVYYEELMLSRFLMTEDPLVSPIEETYYDAAKHVTPSDKMCMMLNSVYVSNGMNDKSLALVRQRVDGLIPGYDTAQAPESLAVPDTASEDEKNSISLWLQVLADQYVNRNDSTTGFNIYEQSLYLDDSNVMALNNYAYFLALQDRDLEKAENMSLRAITIESDSPTYLDTYAYILFKRGEYERAKIYQEMAFEKMEDGNGSSEFHEHYGDILYMCGETDKALEEWQKAIDAGDPSELVRRKVQQKKYLKE
jgi:tetratricopeptide (TPR) repeat protein